MADRVVKYKFDADLGSLQTKLAAAGQSVGKFGKDLNALDAQGAKMRAGLTSLGATAGKFGLAAAAGLGVAVKSAMSFESSFARMEGLVGVASSQLEQWKGQILELGPAYGISANQAADAMFFITSAGMEGADAMGALDASLKASAVGLGDVNTIADLATSAMNAYGSDTLSAADATDTLTAAVREGKLEPDQLAGAMGRVLPVASAMGVSFDEVGAAMAAMSRTGTNASEAATQIRGILTSVLSPSRQAAKGFEAVGLSAEGLQETMRSDGLYAALVQIMDAFDGNASATEAVFGNVRALSGVMDLMGSNAAATEQIFAELSDSTGALDDAFGAVSETAGFKTKQAFAEVQSALIEIGDGALPAVAKGMSGLATGLGAIPDPAKSAAASLLGITAVLGGGLWFTSKMVNGVAGMRTAIENLGVSSEKAGGAMRNLGRGVSFAALIVGLNALEDAIDGAFGQKINTDNLQRDLDAIARGENVENLGKFVQAFADLDTGIYQVQNRLLGWAPDWVPGIGTDQIEKARQNIEQLDQALASMVESGDSAGAADVLDTIVAKMEAAGVSTAGMRAELDAYGLALRNAGEGGHFLGNTLSTLAGYGEVLAGGVGASESALVGMGLSASEAAEEISGLIEAMQNARSEALRAVNAELNYAAALDDTRKALRENGRTVDISTQKGRANRKALYDQAAAFNALSTEAKNAPGAHRAAIRSFVDMATQMGMGRQKARELARSIIEIPDKKVKISADTAAAMGGIDAVKRGLASIQDKTVRINTIRTGGDGNLPQARAAGGYITGPGTATSDSIPAYLSNGEYVVKAAAVAKYGPAMFDRLNAMAFADGGLVQPRAYARGGDVQPLSARDFRQFNLHGGLGVDGVRRDLVEFRKAVRAAGGEWTSAMQRAAKQAIVSARAFERHERRLGRLTEARASLASDARGSFNGDLFGNGAAGLAMQLEADRNDSRAMTRALRRSSRKGLDGGLFRELAASGDLNTAQQFAQMSKGDIRQYERLFSQTRQSQNQLGEFAGNKAFGQTIRKLDRTVNQLNRKIDRMEGAIERGAYRGSAQIAKNANQRRKAGR